MTQKHVLTGALFVVLDILHRQGKEECRRRVLRCARIIRATVTRPTPVPTNFDVRCIRWKTSKSFSADFMSNPAPSSRTK